MAIASSIKTECHAAYMSKTGRNMDFLFKGGMNVGVGQGSATFQ